MDLIASRLARDAKGKTKPKKGVKRLSKNESKENKKTLVSKVDSKAVEKPLKKSKNVLTEITSKKKQLIKESLVQTQGGKVKSLPKEIIKNTLKNKKNALKDVTKSQEVPKPKKAAKKDANPLKKKVLEKKVLSSKGLKNKILKSEELRENKTHDIKSKKRKAPLKTGKESILKGLKNKILKFEKPKENKPHVIKSKKNKAPLKTAKELISKGLENKIVKSEELKENKSHDIKSKKRKAPLKTAEESNNIKSSKKVKLQPATSVKVESNEEIQNIKSKKRKQSNVEKEEETSGPNLKKKEVINYVKALLKIVENEEEKKKSLFDSEKPPILLHINCVKVPKVPLHQHRITLPHSMVSPTDDVALFVKDLKRGRRRDYEDTKRHYEDIFQKHCITQVKTVIPMNQVKTEYRQFEMRRRLLSSYDYFLIDGRISGHMAHLLGKNFRERRKLPTSIHIEKKDLKKEINDALLKTSLQIHGHGDSSVAQVATCSMSVDKIADNILAVIQDLSKNFPGGWENIRSMRIKTPLSLAIPIYITLKSRNNVEVPVQTPKRPKAYEDVEGELSTFTSNVKVTVAPDGTVSVLKLDYDSDEDCKDNVKKIDNEVNVKVKEEQDVNDDDDDDEEEED